MVGGETKLADPIGLRCAEVDFPVRLRQSDNRMIREGRVGRLENGGKLLSVSFRKQSSVSLWTFRVLSTGGADVSIEEYASMTGATLDRVGTALNSLAEKRTRDKVTAEVTPDRLQIAKNLSKCVKSTDNEFESFIEPGKSPLHRNLNSSPQMHFIDYLIV